MDLAEARAETLEAAPHVFDDLYRAHYAAVARWVRALGVAPAEVDDLAQEVFLVAHRQHEEYVSRGTPRAWLFAIARRVCSNHRRGRARARRREDAVPRPPEPPRLEEVLDRTKAAAVVEHFLAGLDEAQRIVFHLHEIDGLTAPEIAEATGMRAATIYARLRLARRKFDRVIARYRLGGHDHG